MFKIPKPGRLAGAVVLSLALVGAGCGSSDSGDTATAAESADGAESGGSGLPELAGSTVSGAQLDTNDLAGQDTVVWFWAPW